MVHYEKELTSFKANLAMLKDKANGKGVATVKTIQALPAANVKLAGTASLVKLSIRPVSKQFRKTKRKIRNGKVFILKQPPSKFYRKLMLPQ